jgi:hypothetical protein
VLQRGERVGMHVSDVKVGSNTSFLGKKEEVTSEHNINMCVRTSYVGLENYLDAEKSRILNI